MGYQYGTGICEGTLLRQPDNKTIEYRLHLAFDEVKVFGVDDANQEHFNLRNELYKKYLETSESVAMSLWQSHN